MSHPTQNHNVATSVAIAQTDDLPTLNMRFRRPSFRPVLKRVFDVTTALAMIILFAPLFLLVAALIYMIDGGPVWFAHTRVGKNGVPFKCLKFRTMIRDADAALAHILATDPVRRAQWEYSQKMDDDPRIIPVIGHILRATSLDELPQVFNILRGDMSVVGPRPVVESELKRYGGWVKHYLSVRPGLTGPWQIGGRSDDSYEERVRKDVSYVDNWGLRSDAMIVLRTAGKFLALNTSGAR